MLIEFCAVTVGFDVGTTDCFSDCLDVPARHYFLNAAHGTALVKKFVSGFSNENGVFCVIELIWPLYRETALFSGKVQYVPDAWLVGPNIVTFREVRPLTFKLFLQYS